MLKKMLKSCLAIALVGAMAAPAFADVKLSGRVRGAVQITNKDIYGSTSSSTDFESDARIQVYASAEENGWTGYASWRMDYDENVGKQIASVTDSNGDTSTVTIGRSADDQEIKANQKYIGVKNDMIDIRIGRQYIHSLSPCYYYWIASNITMVQFPGEYLGGYLDVVTFQVLPAGLAVSLGINNEANSSGKTFSQTDMLVRFDKFFGAIQIQAQIGTRSKAVGDGYTAPVGGAEDGYASTDMGASATIAFGKTGLSLGVGLDLWVEKAGNAADATATTFIDLGLMFKIADMKVLAYYGTTSSITGSGTAKNDPTMAVEWSKYIAGGLRTYAGYTSYSFSDGNLKYTQMGGGLRYDF
jgi:hypothetical protein